MLPTPPGDALTDGALLVRLAAPDRGWAARLPAVPQGRTLTVTVGHPTLLPVAVDDLVSGGYRLAGVASAERPVGLSVDVLVPRELREDQPAWWSRLLAGAERVFDLRHGPVLRVLEDQLRMHVGASTG